LKNEFKNVLEKRLFLPINKTNTKTILKFVKISKKPKLSELCGESFSRGRSKRQGSPRAHTPTPKQKKKTNNDNASEGGKRLVSLVWTSRREVQLPQYVFCILQIKIFLLFSVFCLFRFGFLCFYCFLV